MVATGVDWDDDPPPDPAKLARETARAAKRTASRVAQTDRVLTWGASNLWWLPAAPLVPVAYLLGERLEGQFSPWVVMGAAVAVVPSVYSLRRGLARAATSTVHRDELLSANDADDLLSRAVVIYLNLIALTAASVGIFACALWTLAT